jgi:hypothetical protein
MNIATSYKSTLWFALALMLFWLLVSCSSAPKKPELNSAVGKEWNVSVDKTIVDPQRAARLKQLGDELVAVSSSIQKDIDNLNMNLMELNETYAASHDQFERLLEEFRQQRKPKFDRYRDIIFAMRDEASAAEWKALTK